MTNRVLNPSEVIPFIFAGKSYFELKSLVTGNTIDFKVVKNEERDIFIVNSKIQGQWQRVAVIGTKQQKRS